jgi:hypothetical protein
MAQYVQSSRIEVFFCEQSSPWQRGTNEDTDGLPKGTDMSQLTQEDLDQAAYSLNTVFPVSSFETRKRGRPPGHPLSSFACALLVTTLRACRRLR